jgi:hypothetical protein
MGDSGYKFEFMNNLFMMKSRSKTLGSRNTARPFRSRVSVLRDAASIRSLCRMQMSKALSGRSAA